MRHGADPLEDHVYQLENVIEASFPFHVSESAEGSYLFRLPESRNGTVFSLLAERSIDNSTEVLSCDIPIGSTLRNTLCRTLTQYVEQLPNKEGRPTLHRMRIPAQDIEHAVLLRLRKQPGFLAVGAVTAEQAVLYHDNSLWGGYELMMNSLPYDHEHGLYSELWTGLEIEVQTPSVETSLRFRKLATSILRYNVKWDVLNASNGQFLTRASSYEPNPTSVPHSETVGFQPILRQSLIGSSEVKYLRTHVGDVLSFHGDPSLSPGIADFQYLELAVLTDGMTRGVRISVTVDILGSFGQLIGRYVMAWVGFTFGAAVLIWKEQMNTWKRTGTEADTPSRSMHPSLIEQYQELCHLRLTPLPTFYAISRGSIAPS